MGRIGKVKGRSEITYKNKLREMKKFYSNTFRNSKKSKEINDKAGYKKSSYFYLSYPTFDSYLNAKGKKDIKSNELKTSNKTSR